MSGLLAFLIFKMASLIHVPCLDSKAVRFELVDDNRLWLFLGSCALLRRHGRQAWMTDNDDRLGALVLILVKYDKLVRGDFECQTVIGTELLQKFKVRLIVLFCSFQIDRIGAVIKELQAVSVGDVLANLLQGDVFPGTVMLDAAQLGRADDGQALDLYDRRQGRQLNFVDFKGSQGQGFQSIYKRVPVERLDGDI